MRFVKRMRGFNSLDLYPIARRRGGYDLKRWAAQAIIVRAAEIPPIEALTDGILDTKNAEY